MSSDYIYIFCIPGSNPRNGGGIEASTSRRANEVTSSVLFSDTSSVTHSLPPAHCHAECSMQTTLDVPSDWAPMPARRRNSCSAYIDNPVSNLVAIDRCAPSSLNFGCNAYVEPQNCAAVHRRSTDYFIPDAHSTPVSQENRRADVNGNEADTLSPTCCCLMFSRQDSMASDNQSRDGVSGSLAFAKDCWQRLCDWSCCIHCLSLVTFKSFRCLLILFASLGLGCIISGIALGILRMVVYGSFFVLSIMFVGLGVLMIAIVIIGWRCTPAGHEPCRQLFNRCMVRTRSGQRQPESSERSNRNFDRNQWFGGVIYPEFRSRTPPPPYSSSTLEVANVALSPPITIGARIEADVVPNTPPPAYRLFANVMQSSESAPPSYCLGSHCTDASSSGVLFDLEVHDMCGSRSTTSSGGEATEVLRSSSIAKYGHCSTQRLAVSNRRMKSNCDRFPPSAAAVNDQVAGPSSASPPSVRATVRSDVSVPAQDAGISLVSSMPIGRVPVSIRSRGSAVSECSSVKLDSVI